MLTTGLAWQNQNHPPLQAFMSLEMISASIIKAFMTANTKTRYRTAIPKRTTKMKKRMPSRNGCIDQYVLKLGRPSRWRGRLTWSRSQNVSGDKHENVSVWLLYPEITILYKSRPSTISGLWSLIWIPALWDRWLVGGMGRARGKRLHFSTYGLWSVLSRRDSWPLIIIQINSIYM